MSFCVPFMILCACAFILNSQWTSGDTRGIPSLAAKVRKTRCELLIQEMVSVLDGPLFQTRLSIPVRVRSDQERRLWWTWVGQCSPHCGLAMFEQIQLLSFKQKKKILGKMSPGKIDYFSVDLWFFFHSVHSNVCNRDQAWVCLPQCKQFIKGIDFLSLVAFM